MRGLFLQNSLYAYSRCTEFVNIRPSPEHGIIISLTIYPRQGMQGCRGLAARQCRNIERPSYIQPAVGMNPPITSNLPQATPNLDARNQLTRKPFAVHCLKSRNMFLQTVNHWSDSTFQTSIPSRGVLCWSDSTIEDVYQ